MVRRIRILKRREYLAFNKNGIGGIQVFAKSKKEAERKAKRIYGKGATVQFRKLAKITRISL